MAPINTVSRECVMAIMAAIKKVLSPSSDTIITDSEAMKAWVKPAVGLAAPASFILVREAVSAARGAG